MAVVLRDYQKALLNSPEIQAILYSLIGKGDAPSVVAPLVVAPTGAGKTRMFAAMAAWCQSQRLRVYILVPRREILAQTVRALGEVGVTPGQIAAGRPMTGDLVQVASVQTVVNRLTVARKPDLIIVDEAHHSTMANSLGKILQWWTVPRVGFTATPQRLDGVGLRGMFDSLIRGPTLKWLVEEGFLAYPHVLQPPGAEGQEEYHITRGDFDKAEQEAVMRGQAIMGRVIEHYREYLDGAPSIYWCVSIEHAKIMADQFVQAGYRACAVWGDMPADDRDSALTGLGDGRVQVVTFCDLINEGIDIPAVMGVGILRKSMSLSLVRQVVGRGLRPIYAPGYDLATKEGRRAAQMEGPKPRLIVLDHVGVTTKKWGHGHPLSEPEWSLDSVKRKKGEKPPAITTCPKCYGVWPGRPRICPDPKCRHSFDGAAAEKKRAELVEIEGRLVEAGMDEDEADNLAGFIQQAMTVNAKTRQKMMLKAAYGFAEGDLSEETAKDRIRALADIAGYSKDWVTVAWGIVQKNGRGGLKR
jgi:DNA repair protein RadD